MEKIIFSKYPELNITTKDLQFSLNVGSGAGACADVTDFYQRTLVTPTSAELFNNVPGNKGSKRIPTISTGRVTKPYLCGWTASDVALNAKEVAIDKMSVMVEICVSDIEDSFLVQSMLPGANNPVNPQAFLNYIWGEIAKQAKADMEYLRWNGDKSSVDPFIKLTNGYLKLLKTNVANINVVSGYAAITSANVIDKLYATIATVDSTLRSAPETLDIFVSSNVALAFAVAAASGNTGAFITGDMGTMFLGKYKLTEFSELPDNVIIAGPIQDFVFTYDLLDENFTTVDMLANAAIPTVRFRVNMYYGFDVYDYTHVSYYGPAL